MNALAGKVAIITGAGRGIGRALAIGFAAAGAAVVAAARAAAEIEDVAQVIRGGGGQARAVQTDVTDDAHVQRLFERAVEAFGGVDIAVVNAGIHLDRHPIAESDPAEWLQTIQVNLVGAYYCVRAAAQHMIGRGGQIITIGSGLGHRAAPGRSAYATSKAGLWMLTRAASEDLWRYGICVNELIPGPVLTEMLTQGDRSDALPQDREWFKAPEDVVSLAVWLASNPNNGPTGQSFSLMRRDAQ